jgi:hypothetical protein
MHISRMEAGAFDRIAHPPVVLKCLEIMYVVLPNERAEAVDQIAIARVAQLKK